MPKKPEGVKYGNFTFPESAELKRKAGSDWLQDVHKKWRKVRGWNAAENKWNLTGVGKAYYGKDGGEMVVSIPCHTVILKKTGEEQSYRGYFPVSQLRPSLRNKLHAALKRSGAARAGALEEIKRTVLRELDADPQSERQAGNYAEIEGLGKVYPLHYESDVTFVYRPQTPRPFKYSELTLTDGAGKELDDQQALLNLPMRAAPRARPNIINAAGIVPWAYEEPPGVNCAVWQLSKHLELPLEEVRAEMGSLFQSLHPEETTFYVSPAMVLAWCQN